MRIFFNELSIECYGNHEDARNGMRDLSVAIKELERIGYDNSKGIGVLKNFANMELCKGYSVFSWGKDKNVQAHERDSLRYFMARCTKGPYIDDEFEKVSKFGTVEYLFDNTKAVGLAMSYVSNSVAVSLGGDLRFPDFEVFLIKKELIIVTQFVLILLKVFLTSKISE